MLFVFGIIAMVFSCSWVFLFIDLYSNKGVLKKTVDFTNVISLEKNTITKNSINLTYPQGDYQDLILETPYEKFLPLKELFYLLWFLAFTYCLAQLWIMYLRIRRRELFETPENN